MEVLLQALSVALMRVPAQSGGPPEVVPGSKIPDAFEYLGNVDFSPDGKTLMLVAITMEPGTRRSHSKLVLVNLDGSQGFKPGVLVPTPRFSSGTTATSIYNGGPKFSPDGKAIVYDILDKGIGNLWVQPFGWHAWPSDHQLHFRPNQSIPLVA
jgi:Tol biopolymer transport system component